MEALERDGQSWKRFLLRLRTAAESGDSDAMYALGCWLQEGLTNDRGEIISQPAPGEAVGWFELAAEQSHPLALHHLAYCYDAGLGVKADRLRAIELYRDAVKAGEPLSAVNLAICYREDGNVRAYRRWIERAARSGSTEAKLQLAEWQLTRRTTKIQKKRAMKALRALVRDLNNADPSTYYEDELPRAEALLELGKGLGC
jgi:TPR repeat protein